MTTTLRAMGTLLLVCLLATVSPAQILWQQEMGTATQDETSAAFLAVPGGFVHVGQGGNNQQISFPNQVYLSKVSAAGTIAWQKSTSFAARNVKVLYPLGAAADATGQVYVATNCFPITLIPPQTSTYSFGLLVKFSATGDTLWSKALRGLTQSVYNKVVVTADGGAVVTGANDSDRFVIKFSSSGQIIWQYSYLYNSSLLGYLNNIVHLSTGGFLLAQSTNGGGHYLINTCS